MTTKSESFIFATYNVLHGYHKDLLIKNIRFLIAEKHADLLFFQEAETNFERPLNDLLRDCGGGAWRVEYAHSDNGGDLAIAWNAARLTLRDKEIIPLSPLPGPTLIQRLKGRHNASERLAFTAKFLIAGKSIWATNTHLAWEGGVGHRLAQIAFLRKTLARSSPDCDILAGDFNTLGMKFFQRPQERKIESILGPQFKNVLPDLPWSQDISCTAPQDRWETIAKLCRFFHIKLRSRFDYIFTRNLEVVSADMLDLPGSDHRPLIGTFTY